MTDPIGAARQRLEEAAVRCSRYFGVWLALFFLFVCARALHFILTPWTIVLAPLWFGPAVLISWRMVRGALRFLWALVR